MGDSYSEVIIKRKDTTSSLIVKGIYMAIGCLAVSLTILSGGSLLPIAVIVIYLLYILFNRSNIEYEYIYVNGELEIDKIMGKAKRKKLANFEFEKIEIIAPQGSHALDSYNNSNYKILNYSSRDKDIKPYVIITQKDTTLVKVLFEPTQKMLDEMKMVAPRKIFLY